MIEKHESITELAPRTKFSTGGGRAFFGVNGQFLWLRWPSYRHGKTMGMVAKKFLSGPSYPPTLTEVQFFSKWDWVVYRSQAIQIHGRARRCSTCLEENLSTSGARTGPGRTWMLRVAREIPWIQNRVLSQT